MERRDAETTRGWQPVSPNATEPLGKWLGAREGEGVASPGSSHKVKGSPSPWCNQTPDPTLPRVEGGLGRTWVPCSGWRLSWACSQFK